LVFSLFRNPAVKTALIEFKEERIEDAVFNFKKCRTSDSPKKNDLFKKINNFREKYLAIWWKLPKRVNNVYKYFDELTPAYFYRLDEELDERCEHLKSEYDSAYTEFELVQIKKKIWDRNLGKCELCGARTNGTRYGRFEALTKDGFLYYGPHDPKERILLCSSCYDSLYCKVRYFGEAEIYRREYNYRDRSHPRHISERTRQIIFSRDEGKCQICGSNEDIQYDHIIPFSKGGNNSEKNIQLLCAKCNRLKADGFITNPTATQSANADKYSQEEETLRVCDEVIKRKPQSPNAWINKGHALYDLCRYDEALKAYDKVLELKSDYFDAWFFKGDALDELGRHDEALKAYEKALELKPGDFDAWLNKGRALRYLGRQEESQIAFQRASELNIKPKS